MTPRLASLLVSASLVSAVGATLALPMAPPPTRASLGTSASRARSRFQNPGATTPDARGCYARPPSPK